MASSKLAFFAVASFVTGVAAGPLQRRALTGYQLHDNYNYTNFFDSFEFFTDNDPTNGYVNYVNRTIAEQKGYISAGNVNNVRMGVDASTIIRNPDSVRGRDSVRISTIKNYTRGMVVADIQHMPASVCGSWPAFWMLGPMWPSHGEIDIIEGISTNTMNLMSLHASDNCVVSTQTQLATVNTQNCYIYAPGQATNSGCGSTPTSTQTYGDRFNANGGGVWAVQWTSQFIKIWFFSHGDEPPDLLLDTPGPTANSTAWGNPQAWFQGSCVIDDHFGDQSIIFDTTFCGDWAGNDHVWGDLPANAQSACAVSTGYSSCKAFVAASASDFANSYWEINSLKYYAPARASLTATSTSLLATTTSTSSSVTSSYTTSSSIPSYPATSTLPSAVELSPSSSSSVLSSATSSPSPSFSTSPLSSPSSSPANTPTSLIASSSTSISTEASSPNQLPPSSPSTSTFLSNSMSPIKGSTLPSASPTSTPPFSSSVPSFSITTSQSAPSSPTSSSAGGLSLSSSPTTDIQTSTDRSSSSIPSVSGTDDSRGGSVSSSMSAASMQTSTQSLSGTDGLRGGSGSTSMSATLTRGSILEIITGSSNAIVPAHSAPGYSCNLTSVLDIGDPASSSGLAPTTSIIQQGVGSQGQVIVHIVTTTTFCPWTCTPQGYAFPTAYPTEAGSIVQTYTYTIGVATTGTNTTPEPTNIPGVASEPPTEMGGSPPS